MPIVGDVDGALRFGADDRGRRRGAGRWALSAGVAGPGPQLYPAGAARGERPARVSRRRPELVELAGRFGVELRDLRRPPAGLSVPTGANLEVPARIVLTVGSDCAIGKMTVSLELDREARARGLRSVFVPTGQTGMAIAGWGIAVDAVVADFIAGAAERLVVEGVERGGELLLVEGQGSLVHPAYSGVTLGLLHGAAPHAYVLCHRAGATEIDDHPGHPLPSLAELVELHERISLPARPARVACLAINTLGLDDGAARAAVAVGRAGDRPSGRRSGAVRRGPLARRDPRRLG